MAEPLHKEIETPVVSEQDEKIHSILKQISEALDVPVELIADTNGSQKLVPYFDVNAMQSKLLALMVYVGAGVQAISPPYNRIHADVEYWKKKFESKG